MTADDIDRLLHQDGVALWGVAANEPRMALAPELPRAISLVAHHDAAAMAGVEREPTAAYYADYKRLNALLDAAAAALAAALRAAGHAAEAVPATVCEDEYDAVEDWGDAGVFAHKTAATRAGLGWIGKTALFVSPALGPWVRLATVFTDVDLSVGAPVTEGACGACRRCVDACPAGAGRDVTWSAGMPRDDLFDEKACEVYTERFDDLGGVCGSCLAVCPYGITGAAG
jgi:epoxyqueuosine reductase QueG